MSNDMNRRELIKRAGALGLSVAALAKLGQVYAQDATPAASPVVDTSVSGDLNIAMVANPQMIALQKLSGEFQKQYPNIKLNLLVLPENEIRDRIRTDVSTQATQFDVVTIGMFEAADYAKQGWTLDVGTPLQADAGYDYADIFPAMVSALSGDDGKLYAAPFYGES
ncbi:MAG: extracellular solute-binding protein, partial [Thermomicrobiales bacterium]